MLVGGGYWYPSDPHQGPMGDEELREGLYCTSRLGFVVVGFMPGEVYPVLFERREGPYSYPYYCCPFCYGVLGYGGIGKPVSCCGWSWGHSEVGDWSVLDRPPALQARVRLLWG